MEADVNSASMLISCYTALGDAAATRRAAQLTLKRSELVLAHDPNNAGVVAHSADALTVLGEGERAKARMDRALLIDPDNFNMRYNFACTLCAQLKDKEAALDILGKVFETITDTFLPYAKADPDLEMLRDYPSGLQGHGRCAEARLAARATQASKTD